MHIIGNMLEEVCFSLEFFEEWYRVVCCLCVFHGRHHLERVQAVLFGQEPMKSKCVWLFDAACPLLASWRWQVLMQVLEYLLPRILALRLVWRAEPFKGSKAGEDLNLDFVTKGIMDPWFWCYGRMLFHCNKVVDGVLSWLGTCPCHGVRPGERYSALQRRRRESIQDNLDVDCPCTGMWAPQVVAGEVHDRIADGFEEIQHTDLLEDTVGLDDNQRSRIFSDFHLASSNALLQAIVKLDFTTIIPVLLIGIMHPSETIARVICTMCCEQYDANPRKWLHKPKTVRALDPSHGIRAELDKFRRGATRSSLSDEFWRCVGPGKFVKVNERPAEALHSVLKARGGRKISRKTLSYISSKYRLPEVQHRLEVHPTELGLLIEAVQELRGTGRGGRHLLEKLGLHKHPDAVQEGPLKTKIVKKIVYHCDLAAMYMDLREASKKVKEHKDDQKQYESMRDPEPVHDEMGDAEPFLDCLLKSAAWQHICDTVQPGTCISLPRTECRRNIESLLTRLAPHGTGQKALGALGSAPNSIAEGGEGNVSPCFEIEADAPTSCISQDKQGAAKADAEEDASAPRFFKIVKASPHRAVCLKPAPGVSRWLSSGDIAITEHVVVKRGDDNASAHVSAKPKVLDGGLAIFFDIPASRRWLLRHVRLAR